ncbi:hypothetical protein GQR58_004539 [Nymphon striatum]|nr:hypothetical protein GQR58_004539 [Nymphon striatum]
MMIILEDGVCPEDESTYRNCSGTLFFPPLVILHLLIQTINRRAYPYWTHVSTVHLCGHTFVGTGPDMSSICSRLERAVNYVQYSYLLSSRRVLAARQCTTEKSMSDVSLCLKVIDLGRRGVSGLSLLSIKEKLGCNLNKLNEPSMYLLPRWIRRII